MHNDNCEPGVRIGLQQIYEVLVQVQADLNRATDTATTLRAAADDHESRLRSLEAWKYALPLSTVVALGTMIMSVLASKGVV